MKSGPKAIRERRKRSAREIGIKVGMRLDGIVPGSEEAGKIKQVLVEEGLWSQYLEVGIGPYAEVFTKTAPLSSVGPGARIGIHPDSRWNNPEPELVLIINSAGKIVGATLGNDVNLRDFEGRSALLLGRAKGQQRFMRHRAVHPILRRGFRHLRCAKDENRHAD